MTLDCLNATLLLRRSRRGWKVWPRSTSIASLMPGSMESLFRYGSDRRSKKIARALANGRETYVTEALHVAGYQSSDVAYPDGEQAISENGDRSIKKELSSQAEFARRNSLVKTMNQLCAST